jgi:hypothetical protein
MLRFLVLGVLFTLNSFFAPPAHAQDSVRRAGERLVERSGARQQFQLIPDKQMIVVRHNGSGLRCTLPPGADIELSVASSVTQCGYTGGIEENWMITSPSSAAGQIDIQRFVAAYAVFQRQQTPTLEPIPLALAPTVLNAAGNEELHRLFSDAPRPFRIWMRDSRTGVDRLVSIAGADLNGYRILHYMSGPADPVTALSEMSFLTATGQSPSPENSPQN